MCSKLFNEKECCHDCKMKYTPFGGAYKKYSMIEARQHHKKIDSFYENPDEILQALLDRLKDK